MDSTAFIVIFVLLAYIAFDNWRWSKRDAMHCMRCHTEAQPEASGGMRLFAGCSINASRSRTTLCRSGSGMRSMTIMALLIGSSSPCSSA